MEGELLKLSLLKATAVSASSGPGRPPHGSEAADKLRPSLPSSLVLFRTLLVFYHMVQWLKVTATVGESRQELEPYEVD